MNITTEELAEKVGISPPSVFKLATNHDLTLRQFGKIEFMTITPSEKGGRPKTVIVLNEIQSKMLILLMKNTKLTVKEKAKILKEI